MATLKIKSLYLTRFNCIFTWGCIFDLINQQMGYKKSNYGVYSSYLKVDNVLGPTNISKILKRNKIEEQKEKLVKIITILGSSGLVLLFVIFIYL